MLSFLIQNNYSGSYLILYLYFILLLTGFFLQRDPKLYKFHILQTEDTRLPTLYYY